MNKKDLVTAMTRTYNEADSYAELWKAVGTLVNLGLLDSSYQKVMVDADNKLFALANLESFTANK